MHGEEREKKDAKYEINKIIVYTAIVTMYICIVTIANVQICTVLECLVWKIFEAKCVKFVTFCILQSFTFTDTNALKCF